MRPGYLQRKPPNPSSAGPFFCLTVSVGGLVLLCGATGRRGRADTLRRIFLANTHYDSPMGRIISIALVLAAGFDTFMYGGKYTYAAVMVGISFLRHFGIM
jgi:hypothetical protein